MAAIATPSFLRPRSRTLIASADPAFRKKLKRERSVAESLSEEALGGAHALAKLREVACDSVLLDTHLPDLDAAEVATLIRRQYPRVEVELVDSRGTGEEQRTVAQECGVERAEAGTQEEEAEFVENTASDAGRQEPCVLPSALPGMIGTSRAMQQVYRLTQMVAARDTTVLIAGETGTGKELVARAIHQLSARAKQPFVVVNCAAIPEALLEAELFGHARGAFTGAVQSRLGRIHVAQGGTLFLDEVGDLPLNMQAKLLRFLQNGEVQRLGSSEVYRVDVRVVCATNVRLPELVRAKQFRVDLYYRLSVFPIVMPPLRERTEDIVALAEYFLEQFATDASLPKKRIEPEVLEALRQFSWPGNVRELQHALERAFILSGNDAQLRARHFSLPSERELLQDV